MKRLTKLRDNETRGFCFLPVDKSKRFALVDTLTIQTVYTSWRDTRVATGELRRAYQDEGTIAQQVAEDTEQFRIARGWDVQLQSAQTQWRHWAHFAKYLQAYNDQLEVPHATLYWKTSGSIRLVAATRRTGITTGFGKAIAVIAQEWRAQLRAKYGQAFPLYRYVLF